jgi:hypothetical protein
MGKFLKKIESSAITGVYNETQLSVINHYKDQPKNGPTIFSFENPETHVTRSAFVDNSGETEYDDVTEFNWEFGYNEDGYPGIYIIFNNLHDDIKNNDYIVCLETNSNTNGKNQTINVFEEYNASSHIYHSMKNMTWFNLSDIKLKTRYFIYLSARSIRHMRHWFSRRNKDRGIIHDDWEIRINVRPTIRLISDPFIPSYTNYKSLSEYRKINYLYNSEYDF